MKPFFIGLVVEHLATEPGIGQVVSEAFQRIKIGSGPTVRAINPVNCFANDPTNALLGAPSQKPLVSAKIACRNADGIFHFYLAKISF